MEKNGDAIQSGTRTASKWSGMSKRPGIDLWLARTEVGREPIHRQWDALHRLMLETAGRKNDLANSGWDDFDLVEGFWMMPTGHRRFGRVRRVPLTSAAVQILVSLKQDAEPTDSRVFAALGQCLYEVAAFEQSMSRLGFTYRSVSELRKEAVRRMEKRLMKMCKADVDAFNGSSLTKRALEDALALPPRPDGPGAQSAH